MLTERRAELLALEYRIGKRIRRICLLFCAVVVVSNLITGTIAVSGALALAHDIWHLRP
jgi:hypothetical protein